MEVSSISRPSSGRIRLVEALTQGLLLFLLLSFGELVSFFCFQIGLQGEDLGLSSGSVGRWNSQSTLPTNQPLTWYKVILLRIKHFLKLSSFSSGN